MTRKCLCKLPTVSEEPCIGNVVYNAEDSKIRFDAAVYNRLSGQVRALSRLISLAGSSRLTPLAGLKWSCVRINQQAVPPRQAYAQGRLNSDTAWAPPNSNDGHWIQYNVGKLQNVNGVVTQGYVSWNRWVASFKVKVSQDGKKWRWVQCGNSFQGNTDTNSQVRTIFEAPVKAQFVRIYPESAGNGNGYAMRAAVLVCEEDCEDGNLDYTFRNSLSSDTDGPPLLASWGAGTFAASTGYRFSQGDGLELDEAHCIKVLNPKSCNPNPKP